LSLYGQTVFQNGNAVCDASGNCAGGAGGSKWQLAAGVLAPLTATNQVVLGGNTTTPFQFEVNGAQTGKALVALNQTGDQNILTASASGTTRLTLDTSGNLNIIGGAYQIGGTSVLSSTSLGSGIVNSSLTSTGVLSSGSIASGFGTIATSNTITGTTLNGTTGINTGAGAGTQRVDSSGNLSNIGTISSTYLTTTTNNVNFGGASTVLQLNGTTIMDASRNLTNIGTITAGGLITANAGLTVASGQNTTLAGITGNNAVLYGTSGTGVVASATTNSSNFCLVSGASAPTWTACSGVGTNYFQRNTTTLAPATTGDSLLLADSGTTSNFRFEVNGKQTGKALAVFNQTGDQNILTASASGTTRLTLDTSGNLNIIGGAYQIGGTNVLSSSTLGSGVTASSLTSVGTLTTGTWNATAIGSQYGGTGQNFLASTGVPSISSGTWSVNAQLPLSLGGTNANLTAVNGGIIYSGSSALAVSLAGTSGQALISGGAGAPTWYAPTAGSVLFAGASGVLSQDNTKFYWDDTNNRFGIGVNSNLLGTLDLRTASGTLAVATVSGATSFASLVVDNSGVGDIFTASSSGLNRFVIKQNGNVGIGTNLPGAALDINGNMLVQGGGTIDTRASGTLSIAGTNTTTLTLGRSGQTINLPGYASANNSVLFADSTSNGVLTKVGATSTPNLCLLSGATTPSWGACDTSAGVNLWQSILGVLSPKIVTQDLTLGNTATASAKFAVLNMNSGTPIASISAQNGAANALVLGSDETIQSVKKHTLTIGGTTTGDINFKPGNSSSSLYLASNGNVGIGTTLPGAALDLNGNMLIQGGGTIDTRVSGTLTIAGTTATTLTLGRSGQGITLPGFATNNNSVLYTGASGALAASTTTTSGQCLMSNANTPAWATCPGGGTNYWQLNNGAISPFSNTLDLLVGNTASSSATFHVYGASPTQQGTNPVASISANTSFAGLVVDNKGTGDLFTASSSGLNRFVITQNGNVGIGTTTPNAPLTINSVNRNAIDMVGTSNGSSIIRDTASGAGLSLQGNGASSFGKLRIVQNGAAWTDSLSTAYFQIDTSAGDHNATFISGDYGSDTSINRLQFISNNSQFGDYGYSSMPVPTAILEALSSTGSKTAMKIKSAGSTLSVATISGQTSFAALVVDNSGVGDLLTASSSGLNRFVIKQNGNVGIGTTSPNELLTTEGRISLRETSDPGATANYGKIWASSTNNYLYYMDDGGTKYNLVNPDIGARVFNSANISISTGTDTALTFNSERFDTDTIHSTVSNTSRLTANTAGKYLIIGNIQWAAEADQRTIARIRLNGSTIIGNDDRHVDDVTSEVLGNNVSTIYDLAANDYVELIAFQNTAATLNVTANSNYSPEFMMIRIDDGVGADIAEWYQTPDESLESGEVVTINPSHGASVSAERLTKCQSSGACVMKSQTPYDSASIGIVSTLPDKVLGSTDGLTAGYNTITKYIPKELRDPSYYSTSENAADRIKTSAIALSGRVPVKVSTINGSIHAGDPLTSSSIPGVAMKATSAGQTIGKALEDYSNTDTASVGKILVFINLSWNDPQTQLADIGDYNIFADELAKQNETAKYTVKDSNDQTVTRTGVFSELAVGNTIAGNINVQNLTLAGVNINNKLNILEATSSTAAQFDTKINTIEKNLSNLTSKIASLEASLALYASASSMLTNNNLDNFNASSGAELNANEATIGTLSVLGHTLLSDVGITGKLTSGLLAINGLDDCDSETCATINTSSSPLRLQSHGLYGLDILNGKVTITKNGNIKTTGEITTKKINIDTPDVASASLGIATLKRGSVSTVIETTSVSTQSAIFLTPLTKTSLPLSVTTQKENKSFTVETASPAPEDIRFNWWIVN
jgi:hypothetical protein